MVVETGVPDKNHQLQVTVNILTCPGWDSNQDSGERQLAVSGNTRDHTAIRAGPWWLGQEIHEFNECYVPLNFHSNDR